MKIEFRRAQSEDLSRILKIIADAREDMKAIGLDQWQQEYPAISDIESDIEKGIGYVTSSSEEIFIYAALSFEPEKDYDNMTRGKWHKEGRYASIHRLASSRTAKGRGHSSDFMNYLQKLCADAGINIIRVDTHEDNIPMRKFLKKNGFIECGVITLTIADFGERITFDKTF